MRSVYLHGGAVASVPVSLLANPAHFPRTRSSTIALRLRRARTRPRSCGSCCTVPQKDWTGSNTIPPSSTKGLSNS
jgi:hypothetical protein